MRGNDRCDEILRLIDAALDDDAPAARRPAAGTRPPSPQPRPSAPPIAHPASRTRQGWLRRLHRRPSADPRFVAPPAAVPIGPARFAPGLRTAGELAGRATTGPATALPEAG